MINLKKILETCKLFDVDYEILENDQHYIYFDNRNSMLYMYFHSKILTIIRYTKFSDMYHDLTQKERDEFKEYMENEFKITILEIVDW